MSNASRMLQEGLLVDHTPASAVTGGQILQIGALSAFAPNDIAAAAVGAVAVEGVIRGPWVGGIVCNIGDNVWWDADGTPYGGAATGAFTGNAAAGDWWAGTLVRPTTATGATADIALNRENPDLPAWQGKTHILVVDDTTLVAATHSGGVVHVTANVGLDVTITMPTGVVGMDWVIQNDDADGAMILKVAHDGAEVIAGANLSVAAGEAAHCVKATIVRGDYLHLVCNVAATSWRCVGKRGIWAAV